MRATRNTGNGIGRALTIPALEAKKARKNAAKKIRKQIPFGLDIRLN